MPLTENDDVQIVEGPQGGYHVDISARMTNLCRIVYLRARMLIDVAPLDDPITLFDDYRLVEAPREAGGGAVQTFWGVQGLLPCEWWPEEPEGSAACNGAAGGAGDIEAADIVLRVAVSEDPEPESQTSDRGATDEVRVRLVWTED